MLQLGRLNTEGPLKRAVMLAVATVLLLVVKAGPARISHGGSPRINIDASAAVSQLYTSRQQQRLLRQVSAKEHRSHLAQHTISASVAKAEVMLKSTKEERAHRIMAAVLAGSGKTPCCMLRNFDTNMRSVNPNVDIFVFSIGNAAATDTATCVLPNVYYMELAEHWGPRRRGSGTRPHLWSGKPADANYRNMGHWRLTFQFAFADALGYKYAWQLDDDTEFRAQETVNVTEFMQGKLVAGYDMLHDVSFVTWGLPELTRTFIVAESLIPRGTLYTKHTKPPGLQGLYTVTNITNTTGEPSGYKVDGSEGGWDRWIIRGDCLVMDVDFMHDPLVQRFLELVVSTQYHYRFRWNEQSVLAMLVQLFVPEEQLGKLPLTSWNHGRKHWTC